jgi:putative heme-binding domain-containing protein
MIRKSDEPRHALRALWALYDIGSFNESFGQELLDHANPWIRAWSVRFLGEERKRLEGPTFMKLVDLAEKDTSPDVRVQLASAWQKLGPHFPPKYNRSLLEALMLRSEDAGDPTIPLMTWIAYEPLVVKNQEAILPWLEEHVAKYAIVRDQIVPRVLRRLVATGKAFDLESAVGLLTRLKDVRALGSGLDGLLEALRGRRLDAPKNWSDLAKHAATFTADVETVNRRIQRLGAHFGAADAVAFFEKEAASAADDARRVESIQALGLARLPSSVDPLLRLTCGSASGNVKREALRALAGYDSEKISAALLTDWSKQPADLRTEVVGMLCGRKMWASALIDALKKGTITKQDLSENDVRRILAHNDAELTKKVESVWGKLRERTPEKVEEAIVKLRNQLGEHPGDRKAGRAVFEKNCMVCHKLRGEGHEVGPDLTGANRRDIEYLLINIIDPNRVVGRDYYTATVVDKSGRSLSGLLAEDTPEKVVLKGENAKLTVIPRAEIEAFQVEERSLMPEGLPEKMSEKDFRDLISYLMEDQYLTRGLITGPYKMALDGSGPIEEATDPLKTPDVKWKPFEVGVSGVMDMEKLKVQAPPTDSTAYVYFEVAAPRAMKTSLELAAREDIKVWVNGKAIHRRTGSYEPHRVPVELKEGTNRLMFKVHNIYGTSWLWARLIDPERALEVKHISKPQ